MAVVLDSKTVSWGFPVAADWELLGVVRRPDLDLIDITVTESSSTQLLSEFLTVAVIAFITEEQVLLTSDENLKPGDEVLGKVTATKVSLDLVKDSGERLRLDVLGSVHAETGEANADQVSHIGGDSLTHVF